MPQKIICESCGEIFFNDTKLKSPEEVIQEFERKCPKCGKQLIFNPDKIDIHIK